MYTTHPDLYTPHPCTLSHSTHPDLYTPDPCTPSHFTHPDLYTPHPCILSHSAPHALRTPHPDPATLNHTPWRGAAQRRNIIYRFSPATNAYGRGYTEGGWPASYLEGMSEAQRAVMEMPYHPRLNRVVVAPDGSGVVHPAPREKHKVDFDRAVFKSDYF